MTTSIILAGPINNAAKIFSLAVGLNLVLTTQTFAGPPFFTDDPEPVDYFGGYYNINENFSLLFSVGHSVAGDNHLIWYFGLYWTWGPEKLSQPLTR